jgi:putative ABC transport system substrate-binding protein
MPVIGFLNGTSPGAWAPFVAAFRQGLSETGYVEDRNVAIEYRWAEGHYNQLPAMVADLVRRQVAVIVVTGGANLVLAAKAATSKIPVVFSTGGDPVKLGLVVSLNRPGGNATGVNVFTSVMEGKRLGLLRELVATATLVAVLVNPNNRLTEIQLIDVQESARTLGAQIHILHASSEREIEAAFATMTQLRAGALLVGADPFFLSQRDRLVALAASHKIPGLEVPPGLSARADEVIE